MKTKHAADRGKLPTTFKALSDLQMLRPINDKVDFKNAQKIADSLAVLDPRTRNQDEYLESLSLLMEHYEDQHSPINTADLTPIDALKY